MPVYYVNKNKKTLKTLIYLNKYGIIQLIFKERRKLKKV